MNNLTYRELTKKDYESAKEMICEAFRFGEFIKDKKFLDSILNIYLHSYLLNSSFSKVAVKDNKVIGFILGGAKKDKNSINKFHSILVTVSSLFKLRISNKENKKLLKELIKIKDTYQNTYKEIIEGKENSFQGSIELFIISKESRGLGVGKTLINYLSNYMKSMEVESMYLYTDTICNYGFYDSQNFKLSNEKEVFFDLFKEKHNIFLYSYDFN